MEERVNFFPKKVVVEVSARTCRNFILDTSINRMNTVYMETLQDDLETDLVEVTAHAD